MICCIIAVSISNLPLRHCRFLWYSFMKTSTEDYCYIFLVFWSPTVLYKWLERAGGTRGLDNIKQIHNPSIIFNFLFVSFSVQRNPYFAIAMFLGQRIVIVIIVLTFNSSPEFQYFNYINITKLKYNKVAQIDIIFDSSNRYIQQNKKIYRCTYKLINTKSDRR